MGTDLIWSRLNGETQLVPVIGHPISQAKSPSLLSEKAAQVGSNMVFVPSDVAPDDLPAALDGLRRLRNLVGLIVTIPHKSNVLNHVDEATYAAQAVGAANIVKVTKDGRWVADILDGEGMVRGLRSASVTIEASIVQIFGAGGAGAAVAYAMAKSGAQIVRITDVAADKAAALVTRLSSQHLAARFEIGDGTISDADIVINASPAGMHGKGGTPFPTKTLTPTQIVADMVMTPADTMLLLDARDIGCLTVPGMATLQGQAEAIIEFLGIKPIAPVHDVQTTNTSQLSKEENL